jgi:hypothetical protein
MDESYSEALHLLALIYRRKGQEKLAEETLRKAKLSVFAPTQVAKRRRGSGSNQERSGVNKKTAMDVSSIAPLFQVPPSRSRRLMTGSDKRLAEALREDALKAFTLRHAETR